MGGFASSTASSSGDRPIDDFHIVLGGFCNATRSELQAEIKELIEIQGAPGVLKEVYGPYLRSNIARLTLNYPAQLNTGERRRIQAQVIAAVKKAYTTSADLMEGFVDSGRVEWEWRGRVYVDTQNVLFDDHLSDARASITAGTYTVGWLLGLTAVASTR